MQILKLKHIEKSECRRCNGVLFNLFFECLDNFQQDFKIKAMHSLSVVKSCLTCCNCSKISKNPV